MHVDVQLVWLNVYIYIHIKKEREREREIITFRIPSFAYDKGLQNVWQNCRSSIIISGPKPETRNWISDLTLRIHVPIWCFRVSVSRPQRTFDIEVYEPLYGLTQAAWLRTIQVHRAIGWGQRLSNFLSSTLWGPCCEGLRRTGVRCVWDLETRRGACQTVRYRVYSVQGLVVF